MNWEEWLNKIDAKSLKIKSPIMELQVEFKDADRIAAWNMYVELLTRVTTQDLPDGVGDEETALISIYSIFDSTRLVLKEHGRKGINFSRIAILVLNQVIRPFTAKWHKLKLDGAFNDPSCCASFREELKELQEQLKLYVRILANIAKVPELSSPDFFSKVAS